MDRSFHFLVESTSVHDRTDVEDAILALATYNSQSAPVLWRYGLYAAHGHTPPANKTPLEPFSASSFNVLFTLHAEDALNGHCQGHLPAARGHPVDGSSAAKEIKRDRSGLESMERAVQQELKYCREPFDGDEWLSWIVVFLQFPRSDGDISLFFGSKCSLDGGMKKMKELASLTSKRRVCLLLIDVGSCSQESHPDFHLRAQQAGVALASAGVLARGPSVAPLSCVVPSSVPALFAPHLARAATAECELWVPKALDEGMRGRRRARRSSPLAARRHCPGRHGPLSAFETVVNVTCDGCSGTFGPRAPFVGCRACNFDLCDQCHKQKEPTMSIGEACVPLGRVSLSALHGCLPHSAETSLVVHSMVSLTELPDLLLVERGDSPTFIVTLKSSQFEESQVPSKATKKKKKIALDLRHCPGGHGSLTTFRTSVNVTCDGCSSS